MGERLLGHDIRTLAHEQPKTWWVRSEKLCLLTWSLRALYGRDLRIREREGGIAQEEIPRFSNRMASSCGGDA